MKNSERLADGSPSACDRGQGRPMLIEAPELAPSLPSCCRGWCWRCHHWEEPSDDVRRRPLRPDPGRSFETAAAVGAPPAAVLKQMREQAERHATAVEDDDLDGCSRSFEQLGEVGQDNKTPDSIGARPAIRKVELSACFLWLNVVVHVRL